MTGLLYYYPNLTCKQQIFVMANYMGSASHRYNYQDVRSSCFSWYILRPYKIFNWLKHPRSSVHWNFFSQVPRHFTNYAFVGSVPHILFIHCSGFCTGRCNVASSADRRGNTMTALNKYRTPTLVQITAQSALPVISCYGRVQNLLLGLNNILYVYSSPAIVRVIKTRLAGM
jgi:hypothetical protein